MEIKDFELPDQQKEEVIAGAEDKGTQFTLMHCEACRHRTVWEGDFKNGVYYECPMCHELAFHGINYI